MQSALDYTKWMFWFSVLQFLLTTGVALYVWSARRHTATNSRVSALEVEMFERTNSQANRLTRLETQQAAAPSHEDLGRIYESISELGRDLSEVRGGVDGIRRQCELINQHLLSKG